MKQIVVGFRHSAGDIDGTKIDNPFLIIETKFGKSRFGENFGKATIDRLVDESLVAKLKALDWSKTLEMEVEIEERAMGKGKSELYITDFKVLNQLEYKPVSVQVPKV